MFSVAKGITLLKEQKNEKIGKGSIIMSKQDTKIVKKYMNSKNLMR